MDKFIDTVLGTIKAISDRLSGRIDVLEAKVAVLKDGRDGLDGRDGKDADPEIVKELQRSISDLVARSEAMSGLVAKAVAEEIAKLPRPSNGQDGAAGADGRDGKDADPALIKALVSEAVAALPKPADGKDGRDVTVEELEASIAAHVERSIARLPVPKDGTSVTLNDVAPLVAETVQKAIDALPKPQDGKDGARGEKGEPGEIGPMGPAGPAGAAGIDGKDGAPGPMGEKGLTGERGPDGRDGRDGAIGPQGIAGERGEKGLDGINGKDGADGLGFDDLALETISERETAVIAKRGDIVKRIGVIKSQAQIYRGVFVEGTRYEKGDTVTWGGSLWHANDDTTAKPGLNTEESRAWRLAVKKGQDGKEGRPGKDGKDGERGPMGPKGERGYGG